MSTISEVRTEVSSLRGDLGWIESVSQSLLSKSSWKTCVHWLRFCWCPACDTDIWIHLTIGSVQKVKAVACSWFKKQTPQKSDVKANKITINHQLQSQVFIFVYHLWPFPGSHWGQQMHLFEEAASLFRVIVWCSILNEKLWKHFEPSNSFYVSRFISRTHFLRSDDGSWRRISPP